MRRESFEVTTDLHTDVFKVQEYLQKQPGILKIRIVTCDSLRIAFDSNKIAAKVIVKMIGRCSSRKHSNGRSNNVVGLRQLD